MSTLHPHATYEIAAATEPELPPVRVLRHHRDSDEFNTIDTRPPAIILEFEDFSYHHNSAVTMPCLPSHPGDDASEAYHWEDDTSMPPIDRTQPKPVERFRNGELPPEDTEDHWQRRAMILIAVAYHFLENNPDYALLVAGHTDTSGSDAVNFPLSDERAANVLALLEGDREAWVNICKDRSKVEDYQRILKHYSEINQWACDPGPIDNILGQQTRNAVRTFQDRYNETFNASITVDGVVGPQSWGAFFDTYMEELAQLLEVSSNDLPQFRQQLRYVNAEHKKIGCGERIPIDESQRDNYRSAENRRVELLFFVSDSAPDLSAHLSGGEIRSGNAGAEASDVYCPGAHTFRVLLPEWWVNEPPRSDYSPNFEILTIEEDLEDQHNAPDSEDYDTQQPETPEPVAGDDPWDFLDLFDTYYPGYGGGRDAHRSRT